MTQPKSKLILAVAAVSVVAGVLLVLIEVLRYRSGQGVGGWFWGLIGLLAIVFGVYEFFAPPDEPR